MARAAQESISASFATEDKRRALWKVYKDALVNYAEDAILVQNSKTLSDERSTTPDDAEAKFVRVVGNAVNMFSQVIKVNLVPTTEAPNPDVPESVTSIVRNKKLWEYSSYEDPSLRRAVCNLVVICAADLSGCLEWTTISTCFIGKALHRNQLGSSRHLSEALLALTNARPEIWTTDYTSKTAASKRLFQYLRNGSQRGPAGFWTDTEALLQTLPLEAWSSNATDQDVLLQDASTLLDALRTGIVRPEEPRQNLETAWSTYVNITFWILGNFRDDELKATLLGTSLLPIVKQYVAADPQQASWTLPSTCNSRIAASVLINVLRCGLNPLFQSLWLQCCQHVADSLKLSLPESSKAFVQSQDGVIAQAQRLLRLKPLVLRAESLNTAQTAHAAGIFRNSDESLAETAMELLKARNGKPYGAAAVLEAIIIDGGLSDSKVSQNFLTLDAPNLLFSPSAKLLVSIMVYTHQDLTQAISTLINSLQNESGTTALAELLRQISEEDLMKNPDLEPVILGSVRSDFAKEPVQNLTRAVLQNPKLEASTLQQECCKAILDQLSPESNPTSQHVALRFFGTLFTDRGQMPKLFSTELASLLLSKLLALSDSEDPETTELANSLVAKIKTKSTDSHPATTSSASVVTDQLSGIGVPLSIFVLIDLARDTLKGAPASDSDVVAALIPSAEQWTSALKNHVHARRPLSLSVTNALRGLIFMIQEKDGGAPAAQTLDSDEFSLLFRLVLYTTKMLVDTDVMTRQSPNQLKALYYHYPLALQLVNEKLTMEAANEIWQNTSNEVIDEAAEVLSQGNSLIQSWIQDEELLEVWIQDVRTTDQLNTETYLRGLAFTDIATRYVAENGPASIMSNFDAELKNLHRTQEVVKSASLVHALRDYLATSQTGRKLLNDLIAAATDLKSANGSSIGLRPLVLLNLFLDGNAEPLEGIPTQRLIFLMQTQLRLLADKENVGYGYQTEAVKLLDPVLSATKETYGEHWGQVLQCLLGIWQNGNDLKDDLPLLHASLRLYGRLGILAGSEEANEDLTDSWKAAQPALEEGLLQILGSFKVSDGKIDQPRRVTAELLRRQLSHVSASHDVDLYAFLSSTEPAIRGAAFDLLHRIIPREQEQISLDIALEQKVAHLSSELLLQLSDTTSGVGADTGSTRQSYLLCWQLAFDHFTTASYKVREMYAAELKEKEVLGNLLELICEVCRITSNRPLDASKTDLKTFEFGAGEMDELEEQRLSMHLYYCCLLYLPGLSKSWFIEQKNRVKGPLEIWTQRYFAPVLITAAADTVAEWVSNQSQDEGEAPITVKTSLGGSETVASIAIDPESPPISLAITLPKSYPLESPTVSSRTRVGISEKNWQSWLRTFQIIIFSTGSIIEGLVAFRRNVQGALKGQTECPICSSIIGTDMQTPNKRCSTCRNTFHGVCLFRWFKSSNSSSCPLCRNNFNYS